jgi:hypothetical protein
MEEHNRVTSTRQVHVIVSHSSHMDLGIKLATISNHRATFSFGIYREMCKARTSDYGTGDKTGRQKALGRLGDRGGNW